MCNNGSRIVDSIKIELVSVGGKLIGRTASDRFNLAVLGLDDLDDDGRNGAGLKRARRMIVREWGVAFTLSKSRVKTIALATPTEVDALGVALAMAA
jgi:hypothetical protein